MFRKRIFYFFILLVFSSCSYAEITQLPAQAYAALTAGYGRFKHGSQGSGETSVGRVAVGSLGHLSQNVLWGGELGVQSGNRMQLSNDIAAVFGYTSASPILLTIKPPIDILAILKYHFNNSFFLQIKAGAVYVRTMTDLVEISSESKLMPEAQIGAGFDLTCRTRVVLSYQQFFGRSPTLSNVDPTTGTANLHHVPSWQAGMVSFEVDL
ncbi:MAG: hypothetical protein KIT56_08125 [Gammaproteobacteria bacterium]|nr:hypothetical protein [Gammaproteobacteria bacterium]MCW5583827.1 hypothetical protein [Gammaproteobacteria bacterium]